MLNLNLNLNLSRNWPALLAGLLLSAAAPLAATAKDYLQACWQQQGQPLKANCLALRYRETLHELEHSAAPWQATAYAGRGTVWSNAESFLKQDTLLPAAKPRPYYSSTQWGPAPLLFRDYGDQNLFAATLGLQQDYTFRSARYAPVALLAYFVQHRIAADKTAPAGFVRYHTTINETVVSLFIRRRDALLDHVTMLSPDDMLGDVATTFTYQHYAVAAGVRYPTTIRVAKANGRVQDEVSIWQGAVQAAAPVLLAPPPGYQLRPAATGPPEINVETFRPHLHFIELKHTNDRVLVAEFATFLVVAEAPLSSANGELILREARKLAPGKPVRYFVAGHHHPHYLGGLRPFVHRGATILHGAGGAAYVAYLAAAPHTLNPDSLQRDPKPLRTEEIKDAKTISDGTLTMQIFCIGAQSGHTNDYLVYYFPGEKLLFEDDLVWVPRQGAPGKASARQAGLYQALQARGLAVETIVQSWPVTETGVKTIIPFADLEQSMQAAK